jgi:uncharacterized protein YceK
MKRYFQSHRRIACVVLLAGIALSGCAGIATTPSPALQQQIEAARTRADHEALVKYYTGEAAKARSNAAEHRKMATSYQGMIAGGRGGGNMAAHCNAIVSSFEGIATQYDGMAAGHRQMAEQAKP